MRCTPVCGWGDCSGAHLHRQCKGCCARLCVGAAHGLPSKLHEIPWRQAIPAREMGLSGASPRIRDHLTPARLAGLHQ